MPTQPDANARGLSLLLAARRGPQADEAATKPLAKRFSALLAETLGARFGLRAGFAPALDPAPEEPGPGLVIRLRDEEGPAAIEIGQSALYDLVEAMFGGDGSSTPYNDARKPTELERAIMEGLAPAFVYALGAALEREDIVLDRVIVAQERLPGLVGVDLKMRLIGRETRLALRVPRVWLGGGQDGPRTTAPSLDALDLELAVSLPDAPRALSEIVGLRVGDVLELGIGLQSPARVASQGVALFEAALGQSGGRYTIRLERRLDGAVHFFEEHAG